MKKATCREVAFWVMSEYPDHGVGPDDPDWLIAQLMQQRINDLDAVSLGEQVAVRQVRHDGGLCLHLDFVCQPAVQLDEDIEGGEV